jgi:hypothetical protein
MGYYIVPTSDTYGGYQVLLGTVFKTLKQAKAQADKEFKHTRYTYDIYQTDAPPFTPDPMYYFRHSQGRPKRGEPLYSSVLPPDPNQRTYTESGEPVPKYPHRR